MCDVYCVQGSRENIQICLYFCYLLCHLRLAFIVCSYIVDACPSAEKWYVTVRSSQQNFLMKNKTHWEDSLLTSFIVCKCRIVLSQVKSTTDTKYRILRPGSNKEKSLSGSQKTENGMIQERKKTETIECVCFHFAFIRKVFLWVHGTRFWNSKLEIWNNMVSSECCSNRYNLKHCYLLVLHT